MMIISKGVLFCHSSTTGAGEFTSLIISKVKMPDLIR